MKNILEYLERTTGEWPERTACADCETTMTWKQLRDSAAGVGSLLLREGITRRPVAVYMEKTPACLAAMFGVIYGGDFYTVIDTKMPWERIRKIFNVLRPAVIVTDKDHEMLVRESLTENGMIDGNHGDAGCLEGTDEATKIKVILYENGICTPEDKEALADVRRKAIDTDLAYTLFTSGSTGMPKGVAVSHRSVIAYAEWVKETFDINEKTVFGSQTPFYFSMSVLDIYTSLAAGAELQILPKQLFAFPVRLLEYMNTRKINTIYWVPTALSIVANWKVLDYVHLPYLEKVLFAGEVMPVKQLNYWRSRMPELLYANLYGPTEVTDICAFYIVDRDFKDDETLPIGRACNNCGLLVLREDGSEAAFGEAGELCARGSFLAMGYYGDSRKTEEVFVQNPLNPWYPEKIYRTGDLVRFNDRGELLYLGRKDFQIKHMGYRIELGEIEAAAGAVDDVKHCACIYHAEKDRLVLFYQGGPKRVDEMGKLLMEKLPSYMRPGECIRLKKMPENSNGKIDRKYLESYYEDMVQGCISC